MTGHVDGIAVRAPSAPYAVMDRRLSCGCATDDDHRDGGRREGADFVIRAIDEAVVSCKLGFRYIGERAVRIQRHRTMRRRRDEHRRDPSATAITIVDEDARRRHAQRCARRRRKRIWRRGEAPIVRVSREDERRCDWSLHAINATGDHPWRRTSDPRLRQRHLGIRRAYRYPRRRPGNGRRRRRTVSIRGHVALRRNRVERDARNITSYVRGVGQNAGRRSDGWWAGDADVARVGCNWRIGDGSHVDHHGRNVRIERALSYLERKAVAADESSCGLIAESRRAAAQSSVRRTGQDDEGELRTPKMRRCERDWRRCTFGSRY